MSYQKPKNDLERTIIRIHKNDIIKRLKSQLKPFADKFSFTLDYFIEDEDDILRVNGMGFRFLFTKQRTLKIEHSGNCMIFENIGLKFSFEQDDYQKLFVYFEKDKPNSYVFSTSTNNKNKPPKNMVCKTYLLSVTADLKLKYSIYKEETNSFTKINIEKRDPVLSSFEDELLYMRLTHTKEDLTSVLPELYTPSAYNFKSEEFNQRLELANILIFS